MGAITGRERERERERERMCVREVETKSDTITNSIFAKIKKQASIGSLDTCLTERNY